MLRITRRAALKELITLSFLLIPGRALQSQQNPVSITTTYSYSGPYHLRLLTQERSDTGSYTTIKVEALQVETHEFCESIGYARIQGKNSRDIIAMKPVEGEACKVRGRMGDVVYPGELYWNENNQHYYDLYFKPYGNTIATHLKITIAGTSLDYLTNIIRTASVEKLDTMIVHFGSTAPDTKYLQKHIGDLESPGFTGTAITVQYPQYPNSLCADGSVHNSDNEPYNLSWRVFKKERFTEEMMKPAKKQLQTTHFSRLSDNFLFLHTEPPDPDWFNDEWKADVINNIQHYAKLAEITGLRGFIIDVEEYGNPMWSWDTDATYAGGKPARLNSYSPYQGRTYDEVRGRVEVFGEQFGKAIQKSFPDCIIWLLHGYTGIDFGKDNSLMWTNGLLGSFIDGMLIGTHRNTVIIDGCECRYDDREWKNGIIKATKTALKHTKYPELYKQKIRMGFGIKIEKDREEKWSNTADGMFNSISKAIDLSRSEELKQINANQSYIWIYGGTYGSWIVPENGVFPRDVCTESDFPDGTKRYRWVPEEYRESLKKTHEKIRMRPI